MKYPTIQGRSTTRDVTRGFAGYNHNLQISDGELYEMENLSADNSPALCTRRKRGVYAAPLKANGLIAKDKLCYVDGSRFVMNGYPVEMGLEDSEKQLVSMGAYVIILPDKKYINTADVSDFGNIEASVTTASRVSLELCDMDGNVMNPDYVQPEEPTAAGREIWVDTSGAARVVKEYSSSASMWVTIPTTYVKISCKGIGVPFAQYDGVRIEGFHASDDEQIAALDGSFALWARGDDYIVIVGILDEAKTVETPVTIRREMPKMDFLIESENRLWGCRYGFDRDGAVVNELYACKLGDFKNWECYMGISTDSYRVSLGTDGQFTGAVAYLGHPIFFKEGCLHKVFGNYPSQYQVQTTQCRGVEKGSSKSLSIVNEVLYYKARNGICAYDGSLPGQVSAALGDEAYQEAVGGSWGNKYVVSMLGADGRRLFVYDTAKRLWTVEDDPAPRCFCEAAGELYCIDGGGTIRAMSGSGTEQEGDVSWMMQTGVLGLDNVETKYFPKLALRVQLERDAWLCISLEYDDSGEFEQVCHFRGNGRLESFAVPVRPRRCDHMRLRVTGCGNATIYSLTKSVSFGSDPRSEDTHVFALDF